MFLYFREITLYCRAAIADKREVSATDSCSLGGICKTMDPSWRQKFDVALDEIFFCEMTVM